ncbi:MAG: short chain dehydrogenase [Dongiaceae bacterium]
MPIWSPVHVAGWRLPPPLLQECYCVCCSCARPARGRGLQPAGGALSSPPIASKSKEQGMKIVVVGATGTIGKAVVAALQDRHEIVKVGNKGGDLQVDIKDAASIRKLFEKTGRFDALVSTVGKVHFGDFAKLTEAEVQIGLKDKLMGQVNLALIGRDFINDEGSITLTSGVLSHDPIRYGACASLVNGALDAFTRAAAIELPRGLRINIVSPGVLVESLPVFGDYFHGHEPVSGARVANAYVKSVEGRLTGQVFHVL